MRSHFITKFYHHSNLCPTKTFSIIQCKIKETPLAMNEASSKYNTVIPYSFNQRFLFQITV